MAFYRRLHRIAPSRVSLGTRLTWGNSFTISNLQHSDLPQQTPPNPWTRHTNYSHLLIYHFHTSTLASLGSQWPFLHLLHKAIHLAPTSALNLRSWDRRTTVSRPFRMLSWVLAHVRRITRQGLLMEELTTLYFRATSLDCGLILCVHG